MNPEQFARSFAAIAEVPEGQKRLRALVMFLASTGGLSGCQRGAATRIGEIARFRQDLIRPSDGLDEVIAFVGPQHVERDSGKRFGEERMHARALTGRKFRFSPGEIVYTYLRPYLNKVWLADIEGVCSVDQYVLQVDGTRADARYVQIMMLGPAFVAETEALTHSLQLPRLRSGLLAGIEIPLPSLAEQVRIVWRVDQLLAMCDDLERRQQKRRTIAIHASKECLDSLVSAEDPDQLARAWARASKHFDVLVATEADLPQLRAAIASLALRGRLTSRAHAARHASDALHDIGRLRAEMVARRQIRGVAPVADVSPGDEPWLIPPGWSWCRLGHLCLQVADGPHFSPKYVDKADGVPFLSARNVRPGGFQLEDLKFVSREDHEQFCKRVRPEHGDIIYTKGGTTGVATVNRLNFEFSVWVHLAVLKVPRDFVLPEYVVVALNSAHCYAQSQAYTHGTGNRDLGLTRMIQITLPLPPLAEQIHIVARMESFGQMIQELGTQLARHRVAAESLVRAAARLR